VDMDTWENFLADVLPDTALRGFVQRLIGYGHLDNLAGDGPLMAVFLGTGPNGKSTMARALHTALGIPTIEEFPGLVPRRFTILTTNTMSRVPNDMGWLRRLAVVPFTEEFPPSHRDTGMLDRLREPAVQDAIRSWAYIGHLAFGQRGFN